LSAVIADFIGRFKLDWYCLAYKFENNRIIATGAVPMP